MQYQRILCKKKIYIIIQRAEKCVLAQILKQCVNSEKLQRYTYDMLLLPYLYTMFSYDLASP